MDLEGLLADLESSIEDTRTGVERSIEIVRDLRSFSRSDQAEIEEADLNEAIRTTLRLLERSTRDQISIEFKDDGPGISEENLSRIFDPFFTTKETGRETGLGLGISFRIIEEHGGKLRASSTEGKGTTMTIDMPLEGNRNG